MPEEPLTAQQALERATAMVRVGHHDFVPEFNSRLLED
jgi:hypothetical protein